jgi:glycosyltransferase involved in cell wall biosynthesis
MHESIKFGIYTSFYNCERFVDGIFNNIEQISYNNFEWHITDDFSSDGTKQVLLSRIKSSPLISKIKFIEQTEKKQMYWRPDLFFDNTFDWIITVDSDDIIDGEFLKIYSNIIESNKDVTLISSDFHKIYEDTENLHSISYIINDDIMSKKINRYHPSCDYLSNTSYSCFGTLRAFKHNINYNFRINDTTACADDSYRVLWVNSFGKYLHIPRPFYTWVYRTNSESHTKNPPVNFNANFNIALNKLKSSDYGVVTSFNDVYLETCSLGSYNIGELKNKKVSLWTKFLSERQKEKLEMLYPGTSLYFNKEESDIHILCLNYLNKEILDTILPNICKNKLLFYYQNQKYHLTNSQKDMELSKKLEYYKDIIGQYTSYSWWTYIRHFIIRN